METIVGGIGTGRGLADSLWPGRERSAVVRGRQAAAVLPVPVPRPHRPPRSDDDDEHGQPRRAERASCSPEPASRSPWRATVPEGFRATRANDAWTCKFSATDRSSSTGRRPPRPTGSGPSGPASTGRAAPAIDDDRHRRPDSRRHASRDEHLDAVAAAFGRHHADDVERAGAGAGHFSAHQADFCERNSNRLDGAQRCMHVGILWRIRRADV